MGETHEGACALRVSAVGADVAVGCRGGGGEGGGGGVEEHVDACDAAGVTAACLQKHAVAVEVEIAGGSSLFSGVMNAAPANQACVYM